MRSCSYGEPAGRKIGRIGNYDLYPSRLAAGESADVLQPAARNTAIEFHFVYGPSAGGLLEPVLFDIATPGESIAEMTSDAMFKTRRIGITGKAPDDVLLLVERINGPFAASHAVSFLGAVEDALGIEPENNVLMGRIIELELERIRNHLHVAARMCEAAAFSVPYNALFYLREQVSRIIGSYTGHRFFYGLNAVGEVRADFTGVSASLEAVRKEASELFFPLLESKIFVDRLQGNGIVRDPGGVGPVARGCGRPYDARADSSTLPYEDLGFLPLTEAGGGDAMDRFLVRFEEIFQSADLIKTAEKRMSGTSSGRHPGEIGTGEGLGRVESPSGDLAYIVDLRGGMVQKACLLTPSAVNLPVFRRSTVGNVFTDFHFNWESFGIWISEIAVEFV